MKAVNASFRSALNGALILALIIQPYLSFTSTGSAQTPHNAHPSIASQVVILVPDIFEGKKAYTPAIKRFIDGGIPSEHIKILDVSRGLQNQISRNLGLAEQARELAHQVDIESAKFGVRPYVIARGTGGLVLRRYLQDAKALGCQAPINAAVGINVPQRGRWWAKWTYALCVPLPGVGPRSKAVRDLAPNSEFLKSLNQAESERDELLGQGETYLKKLEDQTWVRSVGNALADGPSVGAALAATRNQPRAGARLAPTQSGEWDHGISAGAALAAARAGLDKSIHEIEAALVRPEWEQGQALIGQNGQAQGLPLQLNKNISINNNKRPAIAGAALVAARNPPRAGTRPAPTHPRTDYNDSVGAALVAARKQERLTWERVRELEGEWERGVAQYAQAESMQAIQKKTSELGITMPENRISLGEARKAWVEVDKQLSQARWQWQDSTRVGASMSARTAVDMYMKRRQDVEATILAQIQGRKIAEGLWSLKAGGMEKERQMYVRKYEGQTPPRSPSLNKEGEGGDYQIQRVQRDLESTRAALRGQVAYLKDLSRGIDATQTLLARLDQMPAGQAKELRKLIRQWQGTLEAGADGLQAVNGRAAARLQVLAGQGVPQAAELGQKLWDISRSASEGLAQARQVSAQARQVTDIQILSGIAAQAAGERARKISEFMRVAHSPDQQGRLRDLDRELLERPELAALKQIEMLSAKLNANTALDPALRTLTETALKQAKHLTMGLKTQDQTLAEIKRQVIAQALDQPGLTTSKSLNRVIARAILAESLADAYLTQQFENLANIPLAVSLERWGFGPNTEQSLAQLTKAIPLAHMQEQLAVQMDALVKLEQEVSLGIVRHVLELRVTDAAKLVQQVGQKYTAFNEQLKQAWLFGNRADLLKPDILAKTLTDLQADQKLLTTYQALLAQMVSTDQVMKALEQVPDLTGILERAAQQQSAELQGKLKQSPLYVRLEKLDGLREQALNLIARSTAQGDQAFQQGMQSIIQQIKHENLQIERILDQASPELKSLLEHIGLSHELETLASWPELAQSGLGELTQSVGLLDSLGQWTNLIGPMSQGLNGIIAQLTKNPAADISHLAEDLFANSGALAQICEQAVTQAQGLADSLGRSVGISGILRDIQTGLEQYGLNMAQGLGQGIAAMTRMDLGIDLLNFTKANSQDLLGNVFNGFEFKYDGANVWDKLGQIVNSDNWKMDFFQGTDGFMHSISEGISKLTDSGLRWIGDRWQEVSTTIGSISEIAGSGPERWISELGKNWNSVFDLADRYIPTEYKAAKSALKHIFDGNYELAIDDLISYLGKDAKTIWDLGKKAYRTAEKLISQLDDLWDLDLNALFSELCNLFDPETKAKLRQYTRIANQAWQTIQSITQLDIGGALGSAGISGPIWIYGRGRSSAPGIPEDLKAELNDTLATLAEFNEHHGANRDIGPDLEAHRNRPPPKTSSIETENQKQGSQGIEDIGQYDSRRFQEEGDGPEDSVDDIYQGAETSAKRGTGSTNRSGLGPKPDLGPPRMAGVPRPGYVWDPETEMWVPDESGEQDSLLSRSIRTAGEAAGARAGEAGAFADGVFKGITADSNTANAFWAGHRWANKKTKESRERLDQRLTELEEQDRKLDDAKGIKKLAGKAAVKTKKAGALARNIIEEGIYDIPKAGQDLPDAWRNTKTAGRAILKGNWKEAASAGGQAVGILANEAGRVSGSAGRLAKTFTKGAKAGVAALKAADKAGDAARLGKKGIKLPLYELKDIGKIRRVSNLQVGGIKAQRVLVGKPNGKVAVIGRDMKERVMPFAQEISAETFKPTQKAERLLKHGDSSLLFKENRHWVNKIKKEGYTVYDVGLDPKFTSTGNYKKGNFYRMETQELFEKTK